MVIRQNGDDDDDHGENIADGNDANKDSAVMMPTAMTSSMLTTLIRMVQW